MAQGVGFSIDASFLNKIEQADKALKKLADTNDTVVKNISNTWKQIGEQGLDSYLRSLEKQKRVLSDIASIKFDNEAPRYLGQYGENAKKSVVEIDKLIQTLSQLQHKSVLSQSSKQLMGGNKDFSNWQKQQLDADLESYRLYKEAKIKTDAEIRKKREADIKEAFRQEQKADEDAYQLWLMRKHNEAKEHKRVEDEKVRATIDAINKQNQEYQRQTQIKQQASQQSSIAKSGSANAQAEWEARMKVWEEGFRRQEQKELEAYNKWLELKHKETQKHKEAEEAKTKATIEAIDRQNKAMASFIANQQRRQRALYNATGDSSQGALNYANRLFGGAKPMTLNNMQTALAKLQDAQRKLNLDTEEGRKKYDSLQAAIDKVNKKMQEVTNSSKQINKSHRNLINTGDQLMRKFALIFSVSQLQGYLNKLVSVRKEFELQQRSMQAILQNKAEANKIWAQTVDLAVRSPFRVKELVTYTKQLAAYRIETDQLHETTKRLADISAGLGVDMNRLILAYGQVRAAEYLRGTELRQFTEAGIPLLDELAKHFTELEGRAISTADVFGMISKRMVAFEDVAAVFEKMTSAGGTFFNMQEIQSNTLHGMISNLHDSIDLMMNDIGQYYDGVFKAGVSTAKVFVDNWEGVAYAIKAVVLALVGYKMATLAANIETQKLAIKLKVAGAQMNQNLTVMQMWNLAGKRLIDVFKTLGTGIKMALPLALLSVAAEIVYGLYNHFSEMNKALDEIKNKHNENLDKIKNTVDAYNDLIKKEKQYGKASDDILEKKRRQILALSEQLGEQVSKVELDIKPLTSKQLDEVFKNKKELAVAANDFAAAFNTAFIENFDTIQLWGVFGENLKSDAKDFNNAVSEMTAGLKYRLDEAFKEASRQYLNLSTEAQGYIDEIKKGQRVNETEAQWFSRKAQLMSKVSAAYREARLGNLRYAESLNESLKISRNFEKTAEELKKEVDDVARDLLKTFGKENFKDLTEEQKIAFVAQMDKNEQLAELGIASDFIRSYMAKQYFGITLHLNPTDDKELLNWQKTFNKKFSDNEETKTVNETRYGFREITDAAQTQEKVIERLQGLWADLNKQIKAVQAAGVGATKKGGAYEGMKLDVMKRNLLDLQEMLDWFGASYEKKKGKGKDVWAERAKAIQDLRKNYEDLIKTFDKFDTISRVTASKQDLINELFKDLGYTISDIEFDSLPSLVSFLDELQEGLQRGSAQWLKIEDVKAAFQLDLDVKITKQNRDEFMRHIESMFGDYEMSLELEKLNIPKDLAKQVFGVESVDLSEIRKELEHQLKYLRLGEEEGADDEVKIIQEKLKKVEQLEQKDQEERLKKYVKYLTKAQDARVKIKLEELRQIDEVEKESRFTKDPKKEIKEALQKESKQAIDKQTWKDFTGSAFYIEIFKDMENASTKTLEIMRDRLINMKDSLKKNLNPEDLKAIVEQIEKIDDKLRSRQASEWEIGSNLKGMVDYLKNRSQWEAELAKYQGQSESKTKEINALAEEIAELQHITETVPFDSEEYINAAGALYDAKQKMAKLKDESKGIDNNITKFVDKLKDGKFNLDDFGNGIKAISAAFQGVVSMIENLNIGLSEGFQDTLVFATSALSATDQMVEGFTAIATNPKSLGGYIQALAGITTLIGSYFEYADKRLERQISDNIEYVEKLQRAYEKLEKQIEDAYSVGAIQTSYDLAKRNMNQQLRATQNMIEMEEKKKKKDEDRIKDWKNEIEDMNEQLRELEEQRLEDLGGLGSDANYKSAAEEFANAWFDAYREVGDGISGLEDTFNEFIDNVVKKQLLMRGTNKLLEPVLRMIDQAVDDGMVTTREMAEINEKWNNDTKDALNSYYQSIYQMYEGMITGAGELSELSKGIQNITEPQAAAIEAYLNSMRYFVSDSNRVLKEIQQQMTVGNNNPMVSELKAQTQLIRTIDENLSSVIGKGNSSHTGAYLKVLAK